jgi:hypothetical protein
VSEYDPELTEPDPEDAEPIEPGPNPYTDPETASAPQDEAPDA